MDYPASGDGSGIWPEERGRPPYAGKEVKCHTCNQVFVLKESDRLKVCCISQVQPLWRVSCPTCYKPVEFFT